MPDKNSSIDCVETGSGPALLFVPGSYSTPAAWRPLQRLLPAGYRQVGTSLLGYGGSSETRTPEDPGIDHEVRLVETLARQLAVPLHLVGHSFGGTVALAAALAGRVQVASLALFEANPLALMREHGRDDLYQATLRMSQDFEAAVAQGEYDAPLRIIDFWGGDGSFAAMPDAVQGYCRQTAASNVLDWHTAFGFGVTLADLGRLRMPVLLVRGANANPAMVAITDALHSGLPHARCEVVTGAGHFLISSHPAQCAGLLASFLAEVA
jgi:pimeloyl-ACP methyl ester carboxylesterase